MAIVRRVVDGWSVAMDGDEPAILDEELGARLGFARPRKIRDLVQRMISEGVLEGSEVRPMVGAIGIAGHGRRRRPTT